MKQTFRLKFPSIVSHGNYCNIIKVISKALSYYKLYVWLWSRSIFVLQRQCDADVWKRTAIEKKTAEITREKWKTHERKMWIILQGRAKRMGDSSTLYSPFLSAGSLLYYSSLAPWDVGNFLVTRACFK